MGALFCWVCFWVCVFLCVIIFIYAFIYLFICLFGTVHLQQKQAIYLVLTQPWSALASESIPSQPRCDPPRMGSLQVWLIKAPPAFHMGKVQQCCVTLWHSYCPPLVPSQPPTASTTPSSASVEWNKKYYHTVPVIPLISLCQKKKCCFISDSMSVSDWSFLFLSSNCFPVFT